MSLSPIPAAAADRIIRNPHSLPRIPTALAAVVASHRRQDRIRFMCEQAYLDRQARHDDRRTERMRSFGEYTGVEATPSPPGSPLSEPLSAPPRGRPRSLSFSEGSTIGPHEPRRARSLSTSQAGRTGSLSSSRSVYFIPEETEPTDSPFASPFGPAVSAWSVPGPSPASSQSAVWSNHLRRHGLRMWSKNPEERLRQRCYLSKRPNPSWKAILNDGGLLQPAWHRLLRDEYKSSGQEAAWREERGRFLHEFRRERQFRAQSQRRMSSSF